MRSKYKLHKSAFLTKSKTDSLIYYSIAMTKYHDQDDLGKKIFNLKLIVVEITLCECNVGDHGRSQQAWR